MFKRLRLDTENDNFLKSSKETQKNRARDVLQRQMEEDKKLKALEAEYEASLRKKICTQSLKIINWFDKKHPMIPQEEEPLLKRDSNYKNELQQFISDSFEALGWDSEEKNQILISTWDEQLRDPNTENEQEWIHILIKALKDECASFKKQLMREFMLPGARWPKDSNTSLQTTVSKPGWSFLTLIQITKINVWNRKRKCRLMKQAWVRDKFSKEDVQHIINLRLEDNWIQAPQDIKVWIGKHKIVQVCYTGPRQSSIIDSVAVALRLREKQRMRSNRARAIQGAHIQEKDGQNLCRRYFG
jgi:hypothetical protein